MKQALLALEEMTYNSIIFNHLLTTINEKGKTLLDICDQSNVEYDDIEDMIRNDSPATIFKLVQLYKQVGMEFNIEDINRQKEETVYVEKEVFAYPTKVVAHPLHETGYVTEFGNGKGYYESADGTTWQPASQATLRALLAENLMPSLAPPVKEPVQTELEFGEENNDSLYSESVTSEFEKFKKAKNNKDASIQSFTTTDDIKKRKKRIVPTRTKEL